VRAWQAQYITDFGFSIGEAFLNAGYVSCVNSSGAEVEIADDMEQYGWIFGFACAIHLPLV